MRPYIHGRGRPCHIGRDEIPVEGIYPVAFFIGKEGAGCHAQGLSDRGFLGRRAVSAPVCGSAQHYPATGNMRA